jgi:hypothetical protein
LVENRHYFSEIGRTAVRHRFKNFCRRHFAAASNGTLFALSTCRGA